MNKPNRLEVLREEAANARLNAGLYAGSILIAAGVAVGGAEARGSAWGSVPGALIAVAAATLSTMRTLDAIQLGSEVAGLAAVQALQETQVSPTEVSST